MEVKSGYKQTEVGIIPEEWNAKPLASLLLKGRLGGNYTNQDTESGFPLMKMGNIARGSFDMSKIEFISPSLTPENQHRLVYGDVLFNTRNTLDLVGKVGFWRDELPVAYYNSNLMRLEFDTNEICSNEYANYALNTASSVKRLRALATGTTSVAAIYTRDLMGFLVAVPPPREQRAIGKALSDVDALLTGLDRLIAKKRDLKQAVMQQLLAGHTRLPGFQCEWQSTELKSESKVITKGATPTSYGQSFVTQGYNFFKAESFAEDGTLLEDMVTYIDNSTHRFMRRSQLAEGDILFSIAGALGRTTIVREDWLPANTNQALALVRLKKNSNLDGQYLVRFLASSHIQGDIRTVSVQAAQPNLSLGDVGNFVIRHPDLNEQRAIAAVLTDIHAEIAALEQRREKTRALKQAMMQELLTGKTRLI